MKEVEKTEMNGSKITEERDGKDKGRKTKTMVEREREMFNRKRK